MLHLTIALVGLLAHDPGSPEPALTGDTLICRALELEAQGQDDEKRRCLEEAIRAEPDNPVAHGLLGHVRHGDAWLTPEEAIARERADDRRSALLAEYAAERASAKARPAAQWKLALWCEGRGLRPEAIAHFTAVTRLDPQNRAAWLKLGCRLYRGCWLSEEQIAAMQSEEKARAQADRYWQPWLARRKAWLIDPSRQSDAVRDLALVRDPRAVPAIDKVFNGAPKWQRWAVYLLGRIDCPGSSQALASLAVDGVTETVRESAIDRLQRVDPRMYVGLLINRIRQPTRYEIRQESSGRDDTVVLMETPGADIERHYRPVASPGPGRSRLAGTPGSLRAVRPRELVRTGRVEGLQSNERYGLLAQEVRATQSKGSTEEADRARAAVAERVSADLREIDRENMPIEETNVRILHTLYRLTGQLLGDSQRAWTSWWTEQLGYRYASTHVESKPLVVQEIATPYVPPPPRVVVTQTQFASSLHSCFAAGTPVVTRSGPRPIEQLKVGDQVLTRDTSSGSLAFEPVLAALHNPPSRVLRLTLGNGDSVVATDIHRFWVAARGWRMARELKPGDRLRMVEGTAEVVAVIREPIQKVFNLEVARHHDFFVGASELLVHDATLVIPDTHVFDRATASESMALRAHAEPDGPR